MLFITYLKVEFQKVLLEDKKAEKINFLIQVISQLSINYAELFSVLYSITEEIQLVKCILSSEIGSGLSEINR